MTLAPVCKAISWVEPTSSACPSATTITSTFGKSGTLTGLSGLVTKGLVKTTLSPGEVNRKIDQENHSIFTGPLLATCVWAFPMDADAATDATTERARIARSHIIASPPLCGLKCQVLRGGLIFLRSHICLATLNGPCRVAQAG